MSLDAGTLLGSFEILAPVGAGGMGEVYRARDTKLGREVAIKVLPTELGQDRDRLARIDREARVLASLNHPNIAALFGYEEDGGVRFLAMELVPGVTLAERVAAGAMPVHDALDVARQIAEALEEAHARSVIHRDLKPANVKVTPEGRVKVLDFGLAKIAEPPAEGMSQLATMTHRDTSREGLIAGTVGYMSPEQARGQALDARTDVWSFGCVLYEMLCGRRPFRGPTASDTFAAVLEHESDWSQLPEVTPPAVRTLLRRCLEKDRRRRLQSIGDARLELEEALEGDPGSSGGEARPRRSRRMLGAIAVASLLALSAGLAGGALLLRRPPPPDPWIPKRLALPLPTDAEIQAYRGVAVSPAGDHVAYVAGTGESMGLYLQDLTTFEPRFVEGTTGGELPSFSPDGRWIVFQSKGSFRKVPVEGSEPVSLCKAPADALPAWPREDLILFGEPSTGALMSVSANGGRPQVFLEIEGASILVEPDPLPEGMGVLLTITTAEGSGTTTRPPGRAVAVLDLDTRHWKVIQKPPSAYPHYVPTGHLLYDATPEPGGLPRWVLAPFDLEKLEVTGVAVEVLGDLRSGGYEHGWVTPHGSGILAYAAVPSVARGPDSLDWIDTAGTRTAIDLEGRELDPFSLALSPGGRRVALALRDGEALDLWVGDIERRTWLRLTTDGHSQSPLWSPDGARIAFASGEGEEKGLFWIASDGSGSPELLAKAGTPVVTPTSFTPDGRRLLFAMGSWDGPPHSTGVLLYALDLEGDRQPRVLIDAPYPVPFGAYSPDGHWLAFVTLESELPGVYLRAADLTGRRWALSQGWGVGPAWSSSGREVFFQDRDRLMSVPVDATSGPGAARLVLEGVFAGASWGRRSFEVGEGRFLVGQAPPVPALASMRPTRVVVIPNWLDEVRARTRTEGR